MRGENYFSANSDLRFYYEHVIDWDRLVPFYGEPDDTARPSATVGTSSSPANGATMPGCPRRLSRSCRRCRPPRAR